MSIILQIGNRMKRIITILFTLFLFSNVFSTEIYFPPLTGDNWEAISPVDLGWNTSKIDDLYNFLSKKNTKSFILLKDGKIVLEKYFDNFTKDSVWYWASAGKTLTATLVGIAQFEKLLNINDKTSKYLGEGWTSCPIEKENLITIRHQLTMTTGLDYQVEDLDCTEPKCLKYKSDAGSQWYYHNAAYTLLEKVVTNASQQNYNTFFYNKITQYTGISGLWVKNGYNNVFYSKPRSMARFGLLLLNNGKWNKTEIIKDMAYFNDMINTSQDLNKSYGYLFWLNGKQSFMIPGSNLVFPGNLTPDAPDDMFSALGKNGQILNVVPSKGLVVLRMGERPDDQYFISNIFNNDIWKYLNEIMQGGAMISENKEKFNISPNPAYDFIELKINDENAGYDLGSTIQIYNYLGDFIDFHTINSTNVNCRINISHLPVGLYFLRIGDDLQKFVVYR